MNHTGPFRGDISAYDLDELELGRRVADYLHAENTAGTWPAGPGQAQEPLGGERT